MRGRAMAAVLIIIAAITLRPGQLVAGDATVTLTVTPTRERVRALSPMARRAIHLVDSDRADALWALYRAVSRRGEAATVRWALELQAVVRARKGNYLHALCWVLNESSPGRARAFAEALGQRGVAIGPIMDRAPDTKLGRTVLDSVQATQRFVTSNTNLGMILLLAPLAARARKRLPWRQQKSSSRPSL